jgi:methionyl-tRNA formyltransferase
VVVLVVCQPDRPKGRGKALEAPPVKSAAIAHGIEVLQPLKLKDGVLAERMKQADLDLAIVVAYGRILPRDIFGAPRFGTWNVHASLLPRHRGASPIQHAILAGDTETGVTLMELTEGLDEGPMLARRSLPLTGEETGGSLTEALARLGAGLLVEELLRAKRSGLEATPQGASAATYAPLLEKADGRVDFNLPAAVIARRVRALSPWPSAFVLLSHGQPLKILRAKARPGDLGSSAERGARPSPKPGRVVALAPELALETADGVLDVIELQPPGKKPMTAAEWLRGAGRALKPGSLFPEGLRRGGPPSPD